MAIEDPVVVPFGLSGDADGTQQSHPAYAQISGARVSTKTHLYGSDFSHHQTVRIRICGSVLNRTHSKDWPFVRDRLIEVEMSEAQWATFVSSLNVGDGVPCTLREVMGETMPELPPPASRADQFRDEIHLHCQRALAQLQTLRQELPDMGLPKGKTAGICAQIDSAVQELADSVPFVTSRFDAHAEKTIEQAKVEIQGLVHGAIARAGLRAIQGDCPTISLE